MGVVGAEDIASGTGLIHNGIRTVEYCHAPDEEEAERRWRDDVARK